MSKNGIDDTYEVILSADSPGERDSWMNSIKQQIQNLANGPESHHALKRQSTFSSLNEADRKLAGPQPRPQGPGMTPPMGRPTSGSGSRIGGAPNMPPPPMNYPNTSPSVARNRPEDSFPQQQFMQQQFMQYPSQQQFQQYPHQQPQYGTSPQQQQQYGTSPQQQYGGSPQQQYGDHLYGNYQDAYQQDMYSSSTYPPYPSQQENVYGSPQYAQDPQLDEWKEVSTNDGKV